MEICRVQIYNSIQRAEWNEDCNKWEPGTGGFPSLAMRLFLNQRTGNPRLYGYVAFDKRSAFWSATKRGAILKWNHEKCST